MEIISCKEDVVKILEAVISALKREFPNEASVMLPQILKIGIGIE